jgi:mitotic spindle assembly checkpoint protein MAD1
MISTPPSHEKFEAMMAPFQVKALQQQLDHERSLRALDAKKAQQMQQRLERQIQFAVDEANEHKTILLDFQKESEKRLTELEENRDNMLEELRDCQEELHELKMAESSQLELAHENESKTLLERQLEARTKQVNSLQNEIEKLKKELAETLLRKEVSSDVKLEEGAVSPAPKGLLRELNEVRIQLAESQRQYRQLQRATQNWHDQAKLYVKEREVSRSATARVASLEDQLRQSRTSFERLQAEQAAWKEFSSTLRQQLQLDQATTESMEQETVSLGGPPEVATIMRHLRASQKSLRDTQEERAILQRRLEELEKDLDASRKIMEEKEENEMRLERERKQLQQLSETSKREVQMLQAKEAIWKREADSLRALMQTYEDFPASFSPHTLPTSSKSGDAASAVAASGPRVASLELNIASLQEELKIVQEEKNRLTEDKNIVVAERDELQQDQDGLLTKLAKLQAALITERHKAQEAEDRACKLEALAGKGAFNADESRALHLKRNPLTEAIQAKYETELQALRKRLAEVVNVGNGASAMDEDEAVNTSTATSASASMGTPQLDPEKLHQRLKDTFTEHAALFREAVYLVTGYKVDMLAGRARPTFRVRSVYAEQEHDELIFMWPKKEGTITSLDLMDTPFAKVLSVTDSYQYMTKFKSLPAFMASVQLSLFDKTTLVIS